MLVINDIHELRTRLAGWRREEQRIALVPTMGNLHAGHVSLIEHARAHAQRVVVSIFVNPMQFDRAEDLVAYPRTMEEDIRLLTEHDADLAFAPAVEAIYPNAMADTTRVEVPRLSSILEGASRPGHFAGVATIVAKLFHMVQPHLAVFGEKDYQQLLIIRRMVADLHLPVEIIGLPTVREVDGLAMSSRNRRLTARERAQASKLYAELLDVGDRVRRGQHDYAVLEAQAARNLQAQSFRPDYISVRRAEDLALPTAPDGNLIVLAAAWLGHTRLIDNLRVPLMDDR